MTTIDASLKIGGIVQATLRGWWANEHSYDITTIAQDAFEQAQVHIATELTDPTEAFWIKRQNSITDVLNSLRHAKEVYDLKPYCKARRWLAALSARILQFSTVLDVLAQHHPEYVSLVWGSFKFLFTAVVNSERMVKSLAKAICRIAEALPRAEITLLLYPTARIKIDVAHIYQHILRFAQKAIVWYKRGKLRHAIGAAITPWELRFEEDVVAIQEQSSTIDAEASAASRAELRDAHTQIYKLQAQLSEMAKVLTQTSLTVHNRLLPLQETQSDMMHTVILNQVLSSGPLQKLPGSGKCLEFCMSFKRRRRPNTSYDLPQVTQLSQWASENTSRILVAQGWEKKTLRDFLVDLITLIRSVQKPIIFALRFPEYRDRSFTFANLVQMLVTQALQLNERNFGTLRHVLSQARLQDAVGEEEWLHVLNEALRGLPYVFIVLDADILSFVTSYDRYLATKCIAAIRRTITSTVLKIFVSSFSIDTSSFQFNTNSDDWEVFETNMASRRGAKQSKVIAKRLQRGRQGSRRDRNR